MFIREGIAPMAHQIKGCDAIVDDAVEGVAVRRESHVATRVDGTRETGEAVAEAHCCLCTFCVCGCGLLEGVVVVVAGRQSPEDTILF
jgi:hypothetical protein